MPYITKVLGNESGIQYQGVNDKTGSTGTAPINNIIVGSFSRGRTDKPMIITSDNIRSTLGYEPTNPDYVAVQDALSTGISFVQVLRVVSGAVDPEPEPEITRSFEYFPSNKAEFDNVLAAATFSEKAKVLHYYDLGYPLSITGYGTETVLFNWNDVDLNTLGNTGYLFSGTRIKESWLDELLTATSDLADSTVLGTLTISTPSTNNFVQNLTLSFFRNLKFYGTTVVLNGFVYTWNYWPVTEDIVKTYQWNIDYTVGTNTFKENLTTVEHVYIKTESTEVGEGSNSAVFTVSKNQSYQVFIDGEQLPNSVTGGNTFSDLWIYNESNDLIQSLSAQSYPLVGFGLQTSEGAAVLPLTIDNPTHLFRNTNTATKDYQIKFVGEGLESSSVDDGLVAYGFVKNHSYVFSSTSLEFQIKGPDYLTFQLNNTSNIVAGGVTYKYAPNRANFNVSGSGKPNKSYDLVFSTDDGYSQTYTVTTDTDGVFNTNLDIRDFYDHAVDNGQTIFGIKCPNNLTGGTQNTTVWIPIRNDSIAYNVWASVETASSNLRSITLYGQDADLGTNMQLRITDSLGNTAGADVSSTNIYNDYLGNAGGFRPRITAETNVDCSDLSTNDLTIEVFFTTASGEVCKTSGSFDSYSPDMILDIDTTSTSDMVSVAFSVESLTTQSVVTVLTPNAQYQQEVSGNTTGYNEKGQLYHTRTGSLYMYFTPNQGVVRVRFNMTDNVPVNNATIWTNTSAISVVKYGLRTNLYTITDVNGTRTEAGKFV